MNYESDYLQNSKNMVSINNDTLSIEHLSHKPNIEYSHIVKII
jgi:hypothetical protein